MTSPHFEPGAIVVSIHSGQRVRVTSAPAGATFFSGVFVGNYRTPRLPANFHYAWHAWRTSSFKLEDAPALSVSSPSIPSKTSNCHVS